MGDEKLGANESGSLSDDKSGASGAGSPPVEQLIAENKRKSEEIKELRSKLDEFGDKFTSLEEKLNLSQQPKDDKADKVLTDRKTLAAKMRAQAESGDVNALAWVALAEEIADSKFETRMKDERDSQTKREREQDFETRDKMLESEAKEAGMSVEEFQKLIDPYAKHYPDKIYKPTDQLKMTLALWKKEKEIIDGKREIDEFKQNNQNFRDPGTSGAGTSKDGKSGKPAGIGDWKNAKTAKEKEAALAFI